MEQQSTLLIDGKWLGAGRSLECVSPSSGGALAIVSEAGEAEVKLAVAAARRALPSWCALALPERAEVLFRAANIIRTKYGEAREPTPLKTLITTEIGKPLAEADIEVLESADMLDFFAQQGPALFSPRHPALDEAIWPTKRSIVEFEPYGVVAVIKSWNYPFELPLWSIGAALVGGNTVVFKPSELASLTAVEIGKVFQEAGLPAGVLNIVTGGGATGQLLSASDIDMISFTGSVATGKAICLAAAPRLTKVSVELGGKDAAIVCADADLDLAVQGIAWGAFANCGQVCTGIERVYVHKSIFKDFVKRLSSQTKQLRLGIDIGPMASAKQLSLVEDHVGDAIQKGAILEVGGARPQADALRKGFYYLPTIITKVDSSMKLLREETFGPVVPIIAFTTVAEAIEAANDSVFGLGASVWTANYEEGLNICRNLRVGMAWVNDVNVAFPQCPWGGVKSSGFGRELSEFGLLEYVHAKHLNYDLSAEHRRAWWFPY